MFMQFEDMRVIRDENYEKIPLICPVCDYMMSQGDIFEYKKHGCCEHCSLFLAQPNLEKWKDGWRPSKKEINRVIKNREKVPTYIMRGL